MLFTHQISFQYSSFQTTNFKSKLFSLIKPSHSYQCNEINRSGLITPQLADDFISLHKKEEKTKRQKFNEDFKLKVDELCTQKIIQESTEMIVYCKPMMNSAASKTLMKEYSESKRYKDNKLNLFPSIKEFNKEKNTKNFNENNNNYISYEKMIIMNLIQMILKKL